MISLTLDILQDFNSDAFRKQPIWTILDNSRAIYIIL